MSILQPTELVSLKQVELPLLKPELSSPFEIPMGVGELRKISPKENLPQHLAEKLQILKDHFRTLKVSKLQPTIISEEHGRSFDLETINNKLLWVDEFGIPYGSVDYKGATMGDVRLEKDEAAVHKYHLVGLHEGNYNSRMQRASQVLRSLGIPTERVTGVAKILEVIHQGKKIDIDTFKQQVISESGIDQTNINFTNFINSDFHLIRREMQTAKRIIDLKHLSSAQELSEFMLPLFRWLHVLKGQMPQSSFNHLLPDYPLIAHNNEDLKYYFQQYLPFQIGSNMARIHAEAGLALRYTHPQNILLLGNFNDLDSARGESVGDRRISHEEVNDDNRMLLIGLQEAFNSGPLPKFPIVTILERVLGAYSAYYPTLVSANPDIIESYFKVKRLNIEFGFSIMEIEGKSIVNERDRYLSKIN